MFDKKLIESIITKSKSEHWAYPKTFNALQGAGVEYYEVKISTHEINYYGNNESLVESPPLDFVPLEVAPTFDKETFIQHLRKHQINKTSYQDFLKDSANAGIYNYRVDMQTRTVTYFGKNPAQSYIEKVPSI